MNPVVVGVVVGVVDVVCEVVGVVLVVGVVVRVVVGDDVWLVDPLVDLEVVCVVASRRCL